MSFLYHSYHSFKGRGYVISFPDLPGCLSQGETEKEALKNAEDAKREWLKTALEEGINIPLPKSICQQ